MNNVIQGPWKMVDAPTVGILHFRRRHNVTARTVTRWIDQGMPGVERKADGTLWFDLVATDSWLEERRAA